VPRGLKIGVAFLGGLIAGEAVAIGGYILATNYLDFFDRDGGGAMGAVFILGPALALFLALIAAVATAAITRPARKKAGDSSPP